LRVFNKEDKLSREEAEGICQKYGGASISALRPESLEKFLVAIDRKLWEVGTTRSRESHSGDGMDSVRLTNEDSFDISNQNWMRK
jgi:hypothetical protein